MPTSRTSKFLQGIAITAATSVGAFFVWTKHDKVEPLDLPNDPLYKSVFHRKFNPNNNPQMHDVVIRRIPLWKIKPELLKDSQNGGSKLLETFCAGVWGGAAYAIQRKFLENKYRNNTTTKHQLWTRAELLESSYPEGTEVTDHFALISKTPKSMIFRCGDSPLTNADKPRESDGLFEMTVDPQMDTGFVEFRLKSLFYQGVGKTEKQPFADMQFMEWLHRQYAKLLMENATRWCIS